MDTEIVVPGEATFQAYTFTDYTHTYIHTYCTYVQICSHPPLPPIPRLRRFVPSADNGCRTGWLLVCAGLPPHPNPLPCCKLCVFHVVTYLLLLLRCFFPLFPHCTPHRGIVCGLHFFLLPSPHVMLYFSSILCLPVPIYPLVILFVYMYGQVDGSFSLVLVTNNSDK